jgi:hypothetical protein
MTCSTLTTVAMVLVAAPKSAINCPTLIFYFSFIGLKIIQRFIFYFQ